MSRTKFVVESRAQQSEKRRPRSEAGKMDPSKITPEQKQAALQQMQQQAQQQMVRASPHASLLVCPAANSCTLS